MARNKFNKPGGKRKVAKDAGPSAAKRVDEQKPAPADAPKSVEERPQKRAKVSHANNAGGIKPTSPPPSLIQTDVGEADGMNNATDEAPKEAAEDAVEPGLLESHDLVTVTVISSSELTRRVSTVLSHLSRFSFADVNAKPVMVKIRADGSVAAKAISIIEITKSELAKQGAKWYQYSMVKPHIIQLPRYDKPKHAKEGHTISEWEQAQAKGLPKETELHNTTTNGLRDKPFGAAKECNRDVEGEEEAYEMMQVDGFEGMDPEKESDTGEVTSAGEERQKIRTIPRLVMYLSRVRCDRWKTLYGWVQTWVCLDNY